MNHSYEQATAVAPALESSSMKLPDAGFLLAEA